MSTNAVELSLLEGQAVRTQETGKRAHIHKELDILDRRKARV
jgi:hypothetical protein